MIEYNELLSKAALEHKGKFAALASPTLNKQETITFLYRNVNYLIDNKKKKINKENPVLLRIKFFIMLGYNFFYLLKSSIRFRKKFIPEKCIYIRTWLVPRSIKDGKLKDDYFRELIDDLSDKHNVVVGVQPLTYGKLLKQYSNAWKPDNYIIPIGLMSILDIIKVFLNYIISGKIMLEKGYFFKGVNICELINNSLSLDYYKLRSFQAYLELSIAKKIKTYNPKIFLYMFENQAWENAYLSVFNNTTIKTIGWQSSGFSFRFLNFFPTKLDSQNSFFPDKLLTVGDLFTKLLKDYSHFPIPIQTLAAFRFSYPTENGKYIVQESVSEIHNSILYAFAVHKYQYEDIIKDLIDVFKGTNISVHLKFHPIFDLEKIKIKLPKNFIRINSVLLKSLKYDYDLVLFNDNSLGIESLLMGVRSYEYNFHESYIENRLNDFDMYSHKVNKNDLIIIRDKIKNKILDKSLNTYTVSKYINYNYCPYIGLNSYLEQQIID